MKFLPLRNYTVNFEVVTRRKRTHYPEFRLILAQTKKQAIEQVKENLSPKVRACNFVAGKPGRILEG